MINIYPLLLQANSIVISNCFLRRIFLKFSSKYSNVKIQPTTPTSMDHNLNKLESSLNMGLFPKKLLFLLPVN